MKTIYELAVELMNPDEIGHYECDLYLKVTPISRKILEGYAYMSDVMVFYDAKTNEPWFDIPVAYAPFWEPLWKNREREEMTIND